MTEAIRAYRQVTATDEFKELERLRERARHNEAAALHHARTEGEKKANEKWQGIVAKKDNALAKKDAVIAEKDALIAELRAKISEEI